MEGTTLLVALVAAGAAVRGGLMLSLPGFVAAIGLGQAMLAVLLGLTTLSSGSASATVAFLVAAVAFLVARAVPRHEIPMSAGALLLALGLMALSRSDTMPPALAVMLACTGGLAAVTTWAARPRPAREAYPLPDGS